jgi:antitoxin ParD1/3/4
MTELTISIPPALQSWMDARLAEGGYVDAADYLRDLVRQDQRAAEDDRQWVQAMIEEGLASGVIDAEPEDVLKEIMARLPDE